MSPDRVGWLAFRPASAHGPAPVILGGRRVLLLAEAQATEPLERNAPNIRDAA
jgi:hypothetical protein